MAIQATKETEELLASAQQRASNIQKGLTELMAGNTAMKLPPTNKAPTSPIFDLTASASGLLAQKQAEIQADQERQEQIQAKKEEASTAKESYTSKLKTFFGGDTASDKRTDLETKYQIPELMQQQLNLLTDISSSRENLNAIEAMKMEALDRTAQKTAPMGLILGEQERIENQYNRRIATASADLSAKASIYQAISGNITEANRIINDTIDDFVYDQKVEYDSIVSFIEFNQDIIDELDEEEKSIIQNRKNELEKAYNYARDTKKRELEMKILEARAGESGTVETAVNWTDFRFKEVITQLNERGATYEDVLQEIDADTTILNKQRAHQIAKELYGIEDEITTEVKMREPTKAKAAGQKIGASTVDILEKTFNVPQVGDVLVGTQEAIGGFFSGLFGE
ncbi:MAG: hypothetical protein ACTSUF_06185 [Candidatus Heimdallarchaeaceae archaeon]